MVGKIHTNSRRISGLFWYWRKDIKKIFAIPDMRPARVAAIVDNSLGELKLLGVLEDFSYESKMRMFSVWFAEYT